MPRIPKYNRDKATGRARVQVNGTRKYLPGKYGSRESLLAYEGLLLALGADPCFAASTEHSPSHVTVLELLDRHRLHAETNFPHDKKQHFRSAGRMLLPYAEFPAGEFGPKQLKEVRACMVRPRKPADHANLQPGEGWSRQYANRQVVRIRAMFQWGVEEELFPPDKWQAMLAVRPLHKGEIAGGVVPRESAASLKKKAVDWETVKLVLPFASPTVAAMVELQYLTGMRGQEVRELQLCEIDRTTYSPEWLYVPSRHKTEWRGISKEIFLGPKARKILMRFATADQHRYVFRPEDSILEHSERRTASAKSPKTNVRRKRRTREFFSRYGYRQALRYAVERARRELSLDDLAYFHPHQLRHTAAEEARAAYGIEGAAAKIGNCISAAQIYAKRDLELARRIARATG